MNLVNELFRCRSMFTEASSWTDNRFSFPGSTPHYAPDQLLDAEHVRLEFSLDFARHALKGTCTTRLRTVAPEATEVFFDAVDFKNVKVRSAQRQVRFTYDHRKINITWDKPLKAGEKIEIIIGYEVKDAKLGLHFVGPDRAYPLKPQQAWTQGEDEYNRYWFPCHDAPQEKATSEMLITVPEKMTAISNGALVRAAVNRRQKTKTFHWKQDIPHSMYLMSIAVGEFTEIKDKWKNVPVLYYCPKGREEDTKRAFGNTPKMMEFFSSKLGVPYPYKKYSQVAAIDFIYGGMENTSCTTQTALTLHDERAHLDFSSDPLVAHELAHQWFGDLVTCRDWSHAWLNESFATYFEALFKEHDRGRDEFLYEMHQNAEAYFDEDRTRYRRPMVTRTYKNTNDLFDRHLYEKGSLILHMLRHSLGEDGFWKSMNVYLTKHRERSVETTDLIQAIQEATGRNMRPFFDQWIYRGGHPDYKVRFWWDAKQKKVFVRVIQTQAVTDETPLFKIPISFAVTVGNKTTRYVEKIEKKDQLVSFPAEQEPRLVLFDADGVILKRIDIVKPESMWGVQLIEDPHPLGRLQAADALGRAGTPSAVRILSDAFYREKFWGVQIEIAAALGKTRLEQAKATLLQALRTMEHPKVRRGIWEGLAEFRDADILERARLFAKEKSYFAEAEAIRNLGRQRKPELLGLLQDVLKRESWNDLLRCAALDAIAALRLPQSVEVLKRYSAYGHHANVRMTAIRNLAHLHSLKPDIQQHLQDLLSDSYLLVRLSVVRALGICADERAVEHLMPLTKGDLDGRLKRTAEEAIRKIRKGMDNEFPDKPAETGNKATPAPGHK